MTKKAVKINPNSEPENPGTWANDPGRTERIHLSEDEELDDVLDGFPQSESCIELYRVNAQGGRPAFLEEMMPTAFSFAEITKTYGGGRYMAKGKYRDGTKKKMFFEIEGKPFPVTRQYVNVNPQEAVLPNSPRVMETEPIPSLKGDGSDLATALMSMFKTLIQQTQSSEMQFLEKMTKYKELGLFGSNAPAKEAPLEQLINMFSKGVELAGRGGGGNTEENFWLTVAKEFKDPLMKLAETVHAAVARPPMRQVNPSGAPTVGEPVKPGDAPAQVAVEDPSMLTLMPMIKQAMPILINGAAKNADPEFYADMVLDQVPENAYPAFKNWLLKPGCLDQLAFIEPGVRFQRDWWETLRTALLVGITESENVNPHVQPIADSNATTGHEAASNELT